MRSKLSILSFTRSVIISLVILGGVLAVFATVSRPALAQSFDGKTVSIVVFAPPGTPPDLWFRKLEPFIKKHLGAAKVAYINKPGGGSVLAANYIYNVLKPNGLQIGSFNAPGAAQSVAGKRKVRFDTAKMKLIGAQTITRIMAYREDSGITNVQQLLKSGKSSLVGLSAADAPYYKAFFRVMGLPAKVFESYPRFGARLQAFRTGEINMMPFSHSFWVQRLKGWKKAKFHGVFQHGYMDAGGKVVRVKVAGLDNILSGHDIVQKFNPNAVGGRDWKIMTASAAGQGVARQIWSPPGMDSKYVNAWRKAFNAIMADPVYIKDHQKSWGVPPSWIPGDVGEKIVNQFLDLNRPGAF